MQKELHSIKPFRGGNLGVIRLNHLAFPDRRKMKIYIGSKQFSPVGFDTYGHPVISADNFRYYKALKAITERKGESLVPIVEYEPRVFCIKDECYDSEKAVEEALQSHVTDDMKEEEMILEYENTLKKFKNLLINRKHAAFCGKTIDAFIVMDHYFLGDDGRIYECDNVMQPIELDDKGELIHKKVLKASEAADYEVGKEIHIPDGEEVCAICGRKFSILDVEDFSISETPECEKVHNSCYQSFLEAIQHETASQIIDAVYDGKPESFVQNDEDEEDGEVTWFVYRTNQGTIRIRFKRKVIVIEWFDNFKPFNMKIFAEERVTKFDRGIHAWSKDDAIRYLAMAKKA